MKQLDRELLERALKELGRNALTEGIDLEICLYGGSAMLLAYDSRYATKDVDAVINPREKGIALAAQVARTLDLHDDWLNDDVTQFLSPMPHLGRRQLSLDIPGLKIYVATANYLLAMKALSCREPLPGYRGDHGDLIFLIRKIGIRTVHDVQERIDSFFPDEVITPTNYQTLTALIEEANHE